jgi:hypothetical protein
MKNAKFTTMLLIAGIAIFTSCKKEDMSQYTTKSDLANVATKDDLNNVNTNPTIENTSITIHSYDWTWNSFYKQWEYKYPHSSIGNDALIGFVMSGNGKEALPYYKSSLGVTYGLTDYTFGSPGYIIITYYDGSSTLAQPIGDSFVYLKIIPSSEYKPNIDHENYMAVQQAYNLH